MKIVNPYMISAVLEPFLSLQHDEAMSLAALGINREGEVREYIRQALVPYFFSFDDKSRKSIKYSLGYLLVKGYDDWDGLLAMNECPMDFGGEDRIFFMWLWDELFHSNVVIDELPSSYSVREDFGAPNLIKRNF